MFGSLGKKLFKPVEDNSLTKCLLYMHITVGIGTITTQDIAINIHFKTAQGNQWVVTQSYTILKQLDSLLSKASKKLNYIAFPVIDKYTLKELYDVSLNNMIMIFTLSIDRLDQRKD